MLTKAIPVMRLLGQRATNGPLHIGFPILFRLTTSSVTLGVLVLCLLFYSSVGTCTEFVLDDEIEIVPTITLNYDAYNIWGGGPKFDKICVEGQICTVTGEIQEYLATGGIKTDRTNSGITANFWGSIQTIETSPYQDASVTAKVSLQIYTKRDTAQAYEIATLGKTHVFWNRIHDGNRGGAYGRLSIPSGRCSGSGFSVDSSEDPEISGTLAKDNYADPRLCIRRKPEGTSRLLTTISLIMSAQSGKSSPGRANYRGFIQVRVRPKEKLKTPLAVVAGKENSCDVVIKSNEGKGVAYGEVFSICSNTRGKNLRLTAEGTYREPPDWNLRKFIWDNSPIFEGGILTDQTKIVVDPLPVGNHSVGVAFQPLGHSGVRCLATETVSAHDVQITGNTYDGDCINSIGETREVALLFEGAEAASWQELIQMLAFVPSPSSNFISVVPGSVKKHEGPNSLRFEIRILQRPPTILPGNITPQASIKITSCDKENLHISEFNFCE